MENSSKKKVMIKIAGAQLTLITDEEDVFVDTVVDRVNERMSELTRNSYRANRTDAALLCAVDFCSDKLKAERKIRNLEVQLSLYDVNVRRLREETIALKRKAGVPLDDTDLEFIRRTSEAAGAEEDVEQGEPVATSESVEEPEPVVEPESVVEPETSAATDVSVDAAEQGGSLNMERLGEMLRSTGDETAEEKVRTLERYLDGRRKGESEGRTREEKIRYIESLLRGD